MSASRQLAIVTGASSGIGRELAKVCACEGFDLLIAADEPEIDAAAADNRAAFKADEDAYCSKFGLNDEQRRAVASRNVLELIAAGGNIYYLAKFAGIFGLDVQDVGAQQTGMTKDAFKAMLLAAGR